VLDVAEAFVRALTRAPNAGATYELCGPQIMTLEEIVRLTARAAQLPCHIIRLPDVIARLQGVVMGLLPGKPFSLDNFRSLTQDSLCREDGCAALGIVPRPMLAELPLYLAPRPAFP
jgi:NADH dehydrogenase